MKAARYTAERQVELVETARPSPEPGWVVIDVKACGVCGSDLHQYRGEWTQLEFAGGHEIAGVVAEVGEAVEGFEVGDRVCAECFSHCGQCRYCVAGLYNLCDRRVFPAGRRPGGFAELSPVHQSALFKLPDDMSLEDGVMVEPLAVSYRAFALTGATHRDTLAVLGSGTIGLLAVASAHAAGVGRVIATAKYPNQAALAGDLGADDVVVANEDGVEQINRLTDKAGVDAVVETIAAAATFKQACAIARRAGTIALLGGHREPAEVELGPIVGKELCIKGSSCYGRTDMAPDFEWAMQLIASGHVPAAKLVTHRFGLDDIAAAFATADDKTSGAVKVLVVQE